MHIMLVLFKHQETKPSSEAADLLDSSEKFRDVRTPSELVDSGSYPLTKKCGSATNNLPVER